VFAGVAALKGRDERAGVEIEVFTASAQTGGQREVQVGMARVGASSDDGRHTVEVDVFTAKAGMGMHNSDGSFGWNIGVTAVAVGFEGTVPVGSGSSLTAGASIGPPGLEASIGVRDIDGDQRPEVCARAVFAWWTVGACAELPLVAPALVPPNRGKGAP
jgi:hypothetical protein